MGIRNVFLLTSTIVIKKELREGLTHKDNKAAEEE